VGFVGWVVVNVFLVGIDGGGVLLMYDTFITLWWGVVFSLCCA